MFSVGMLFSVMSPYTPVLALFYIAYKSVVENCFVHKNPWNTGMILIFVWSLIVGIINESPLSSTASIAVLLYFLMGLYLQNYYNQEEKIEKLLQYLFFFSIASAILAILEKLTAVYYKYVWWGKVFGIPNIYYLYDEYRVYSTFGNPNVAGTWFAIIILISLYFYDKNKGITKFMFAGAACLFAVIFILTGSRGAAIGLLPGLLVYALLKKDKWSTVLILILFVSIASIMFAAPYLLPKAENLNSPVVHDVGRSVNNRQAIWQGCLNMIKIKPITGWGLLGIYTASKDIFYQYHRTFHGHNIIITLAATLGVVGVGIYIYLKKHILEGIWYIYNQGCGLAPLLAAIQVVILGHGLVDFTIMVPQIGMLYLGSCALVSSLVLQYGNFREEGIYLISPWYKKKSTAKLRL